MDNPTIGIKLMFANGQYESDTFKYASQIPFYQDPSSYFVIRIAFFFDIITFSSYSATAIFFSVISFAGMWLLFLTFYNKKPYLHFWIAIACFFIPSVFFWGSGLLKDTLTLAALGLLVYSVDAAFIRRKSFLVYVFFIFLGIIVIFVVKKYILLCLLPAILLWVYSNRLMALRSVVLKALVFPLVLAGILFSAYWAIMKIGDADKRYSMNEIAETARITAYDIGFYTGKDAGSSYNLGELDGTFLSMVKLMPQAINVSLFRPYLWEAQNPFMLLSAIESFVILIVTIFLTVKTSFAFFKKFSNPNVIFCFVYSLTFAFAVGVSTYNFGTLVRYKIPMIPFYVLGLVLIWDQLNRDKKLEVFEATE